MLLSFFSTCRQENKKLPEELPLPGKGVEYKWQLALNAGQAEILRNIYIQTSDQNKARIDSLEQYFEKLFKANSVDDAVISRSECK